MTDLTHRLNERATLEAELTTPQPQTGAWLTDDGSILVRRYGDTMTVCKREGNRWGPEYALHAESWDFGVTR